MSFYKVIKYMYNIFIYLLYESIILFLCEKFTFLISGYIENMNVRVKENNI